MAGILLIHRPGETAVADRLERELRARYGEDALLRQAIGAGQDPPRALREAIGTRAVALVLIDRAWLQADEAGRRAMDDPDEPEHRQVSAALALNIPVVPVLVDDVAMPGREELPPDILRLSHFNPCALRAARWSEDFARLAQMLEGLGLRSVVPPAPAKDAAPAPAVEIEISKIFPPAPPHEARAAPASAATQAGPLAIAGLILAMAALAGLVFARNVPGYLAAVMVAGIALALAAWDWRRRTRPWPQGYGITRIAIVIAIAVLVGALGRFALEQMRSDSLPEFAEEAARGGTQSPAVPGALDVPVDAPAMLAGRWSDGQGEMVEIEQSGEDVTVRGLTPGLPFHGVTGQGRVTRRALEVRFDLATGPAVLRLVASPDGSRLSGSIAYPTFGTIRAIVLYRAS
jgi:hypothetical protein